jgi:hypothetical protein
MVMRRVERFLSPVMGFRDTDLSTGQLNAARVMPKALLMNGTAVQAITEPWLTPCRKKGAPASEFPAMRRRLTQTCV